MADKIVPLIVCGGSGTRLWPLSTDSKPKQFLKFGSNHSLLQQTVLRVQSGEFETAPIIVGAEEQRSLIAENLRELGIKADIVTEPVARNSCAAIAAGCFQAMARHPEAIVLVLAADHAIKDSEQFRTEVLNAKPAAEKGKLVTFGIRPTKPATGYGYINPGQLLNDGKVHSIENFVEKPDAPAAAGYISEGYLWNSGNFLFRADAFLEELAIHNPEIYSAVSKAHQNAEKGSEFIKLEKQAFSACPSISVDYAVMEKTQQAAVLPVTYDWSDIGSWSSVWEMMGKDGQGNVVIGEAILEDAADNLVHSDGKQVVLCGVDGLAVIVSGDNVLVLPKDQSEQFGQIAEKAKSGKEEHQP